MTTRQYWEVLNQVSERLNSQELFPEFPVFFPAISSLLQDYAVFSTKFPWIWPGNRVLGEGTFQNFASFGISVDIHLHTKQLYPACQSKYCTCISLKKPVRAKFRVPRRSVPI